MSKKQILVCDICGIKEEEKNMVSLKTYSLQIGRKADASGSTDTIDSEVDLCINCVEKVFEYFVNFDTSINLSIRYLVNNKFLEIIKKIKNKNPILLNLLKERSKESTKKDAVECYPNDETK